MAKNIEPGREGRTRLIDAGWRDPEHTPNGTDEQHPDLFEIAGPPLPPFTTTHVEAECWAAIASTREIKVYIAAAVVRLSAEDRAGLVSYIARLG
jgi:hypothetical protein